MLARPKQKSGMESTGLSFEAEQLWPFMFGEDDGNVYLSIGKWHSSTVRLDGLDSIERVDLGYITATQEDIFRTEPLRAESPSRETLKPAVKP